MGTFWREHGLDLVAFAICVGLGLRMAGWCQ